MQIGTYSLDDRSRKEGGQAFVYFGVDRLSGQRVAVKVARPSGWSRRRMKREIAVQSKLDHPNILPIIGSDRQREWYATREAQCSLDDLGPFDQSQWTRLQVGLLGVSEGVRNAHDRGYVHRDLSPGNVLVFRDRWVVADWGFVFEELSKGPRMTQPLERFGTPPFIAPELLIDPREATPAGDVFSIGRLAAWGTRLEPGGDAGDDSSLSWWLRFIEGAAAYDLRSRWTMDEVITYLRARPAAVRHAPRLDPCPHCHSTAGRDGSERCVTCHAINPY